MEVSTTFLIPLATLGTALLASGVATLTLIVNKENKISEFRQTWIDGLRQDLADFLSASQTVTRAIQESRATKNLRFNNPMPIDEATTGKLRLQVAESFYRIKLRLNEGEETHLRLETLLISSTTLVGGYLSGISNEANEVLNGIDIAATQARVVLKAEWTRVKEGEPSYRGAKTAAATLWKLAVIALIAGSMWFIFETIVKPNWV